MGTGATIDVKAAKYALSGAYPAPGCRVAGDAAGRLFEPEGSELWEVDGELSPGATIEWLGDQGEHAVHVLSGELDVDGQHCGAGGAVIVEAGVAAMARALAPTRVVHFGAWSLAPLSPGPFGTAAPGRCVHVFADEAAARAIAGMSVIPRYFTDGSCPTCRTALFVMDGRRCDSGHVSRSHVHAQDEIIHVLDGALQVGARRITPGMSMSVLKGTRYGFRTSGPFRFVNYRRDVSTVQLAPGDEPVLETVEAIERAFQHAGH